MMTVKAALTIVLMGLGAATVAAQTEQWRATYPVGLDDRPALMTLDATGQTVYVTGRVRFVETPDSPVSWGTIALDATTGQQVWAALYPDRARVTNTVRALVLDGSGTLYVAGLSEEPGAPFPPPLDDTIVAYDAATGNVLWETRRPTPPSSPGLAGLTVDGNAGIVYSVTTEPQDVEPFTQYLTIAYDAASGNELWEQRYSVGTRDNLASVISSDGAGGIYVGGASRVVPGGPARYGIVKYSQDGALVVVPAPESGEVKQPRVQRP